MAFEKNTNQRGRAPRVSHVQTANERTADIIGKASGAVKGGKREDDGLYFTNNEGIPCPDAEHSKTIGVLPLASDVFLFQKQQHFNRSKNLERMVHPCGSGAFGYFQCTKDVTGLTNANFLSTIGEMTPVFVPFSTVTLGREYPDEARNPRGFAIKFYTMEGNYDIVGLNFPVFFCRDPIQGPDVIRSQHRNPRNFLLDYDALFDLLGNAAESNHAGLMFFSDFGTPQGWRFNHGHGEVTRICGENPDYSKRDLWNVIEAGEEVTWTAHVQVMQPEDADAEKLGFDPFDVTKYPENFHRDVEQAAFSSGSMVPGIEDSSDPLLQSRMFFYRDTQYHRIDQYAPNTSPMNSDQIQVKHLIKLATILLVGKATTSMKGKKNEYGQARDLWTKVISEQQRHNTIKNTANLLQWVKYAEIQKKYLSQVYNISNDYAQGIYDLLPKKDFEFAEVQKFSEDAHLWYKGKKFRSS
ncbi:heme-dependent catalase [Patellaria atrata CBS 101060]|uniref:Heme-dependent catalase n=1 Tax=Patellaria atrata CBS 101060 TaxID=1346257 RepID=A0A9P4VUL9_9PEZI|nr:heme-dependent catalase [Patellaria atrata CBS 101060]